VRTLEKYERGAIEAAIQGTLTVTARTKTSRHCHIGRGSGMAIADKRPWDSNTFWLKDRDAFDGHHIKYDSRVLEKFVHVLLQTVATNSSSSARGNTSQRQQSIVEAV